MVKTILFHFSGKKNGIEGNHSLVTDFPLKQVHAPPQMTVNLCTNSPPGGRLFTSSALSSAQKPSFVITKFHTGGAVYNIDYFL